MVSKYSFISVVRRHMIDSWKNIDEILQKVCKTTYKSEKTRLLNMIGAQRARIFIRMGQVAERLDLTPF